MFGINKKTVRQRAVHLAFYPATSAVKLTLDAKLFAKALAVDCSIERRRSAAALGTYDILRRVEFKEYVRDREREIAVVEAEYLDAVRAWAPELLGTFAVSPGGVAVPV